MANRELLVPTYQYACTACEHRFDIVQSFSDASLTECPECAGRLRKLYGSVGVVFKGSGFYRTDSRSESKSSSTSEKSSDKTSDKSSGSETKSETKKADSSAKESNSSSSTTTTTKPAAAAS
jgi:putative FmdB family regulatory protein